MTDPMPPYRGHVPFGRADLIAARALAANLAPVLLTGARVEWPDGRYLHMDVATGALCCGSARGLITTLIEVSARTVRMAFLDPRFRRAGAGCDVASLPHGAGQSTVANSTSQQASPPA